MRSKNQEHFTLLESFIDTYIDSQGVSPSTREIAAGTGLSPSTVSRYLSYMRDNGMIDYVGQRNIITQRKRMTAIGSNKVPLLGAVSCGKLPDNTTILYVSATNLSLLISEMERSFRSNT